MFQIGKHLEGRAFGKATPSAGKHKHMRQAAGSRQHTHTTKNVIHSMQGGEDKREHISACAFLSHQNAH
jgi:hypothetical protein